MNHPSPQSHQHFSGQLHGIRGIAACVVVMSHAVSITSAYDSNFWLPAGLFNGLASVVLFFVLSGLVLCPSAQNARKSASDLFSFYVRRAFRLLPLMIVVNIVSAFFVREIHPLLPYREPLTGPFGLEVFLLGFLGATMKLNGPSWSTFVEIVASLLMPLMAMVAAHRLRVIWMIAALFIAFLPIKTIYQLHIFIVPFFAGACIPYVVGKLPVRLNAVLVAAICICLATMFYLARPAFHWIWPSMDLNGNPLVVLTETILISPAIAIMFKWSRPRFLAGRSFQILGDLSFGIYLLHFNILTVAYNMVRAIGVDGGWPAFLLTSACTFAVTLPVASLANKYVELPGIKSGRKVADFAASRFFANPRQA